VTDVHSASTTRLVVHASLVLMEIVYVSDSIVKVKIKSEFVDDLFPQREGLKHKFILHVLVFIIVVYCNNLVKVKHLSRFK